MRKLKFRAWDKESKEMLYPDDIYGPYIGDNTNIIMNLLAVAINDNWGSDEFTEQYELMQHTGLCDVNKVDIYEGDIIEMIEEWYDSDYKTKGFLGEVVFEDGCFGIKSKGIMDWLQLDTCSVHNYEFKVVANKYQW